jgi:hypothetical protein
MRAFSPKNSTSMPVPVTSRSQTKAASLPARSRCTRTANELLVPPLAGSTSTPRPERNATNRS